MNEFFRRRPATLADWPGIAALDQENFGAYGAQEEPAIIRSRLLTFPQGCAALEGDDSDGRRFIAGYLTTEKWTELREPALDEEPQAEPSGGWPRVEYHDAGGRSRLPEPGIGGAPAGPRDRGRAGGGGAGRSSWKPRTPNGSICVTGFDASANGRSEESGWRSCCWS